MTKARKGTLLAAGCLLLGASTVPAWADPTVPQMLNAIRPRQEGVACSTPTAQEENACRVDPVQKPDPANKAKKVTIGWLLRDPKGLPLRRFVDTNDDNKIDLWSYYQDGVEVYREVASTFTKDPNQFRWMNTGGTKWGIDLNGDGKIDTWKMISAEEVSQEVLQAVITRDLNRLRTLMLSEADIKALELPAAEASRIRELQRQAPAKFQSTVAKLTGLSDKTRWLHMETATPPQCLPAELTGMKYDLVKHANVTILYETNGQNDWLQTGEMIQIGMAWRLLDAPTAGLASPAGPQGAKTVDDKELQALLDQLKKLDDKAPKAEPMGPNADAVRYNLQRAELLEKIVARVQPEERELWIRQVADCLSAAVQSSPPADKTAYQRLQDLKTQITKAMPGSNLAGYVTFREMSAEYALKLSNPDVGFEKVQQEWLDKLAKFVQEYQRSDDTPAALEQLGMVSEMLTKEGEAKKWYQMLVQNFADKPQAAKAQGALRRLDLEGKALELAGPALGTNAPFDIARSQGKVVVVYYWASWNQQCAADFARLKLLLENHGSKGVELIGVNLDSTAQEAADFIRKTSAPGTHLFVATGPAAGLESPLATHYGIMVLPNLFLVGKDGKVVSRTVQINNLEEEVKKQLNK